MSCVGADGSDAAAAVLCQLRWMAVTLDAGSVPFQMLAGSALVTNAKSNTAAAVLVVRVRALLPAITHWTAPSSNARCAVHPPANPATKLNAAKMHTHYEMAIKLSRSTTSMCQAGLDRVVEGSALILKGLAHINEMYALGVGSSPCAVLDLVYLLESPGWR